MKEFGMILLLAFLYRNWKESATLGGNAKWYSPSRLLAFAATAGDDLPAAALMLTVTGTVSKSFDPKVSLGLFAIWFPITILMLRGTGDHSLRWQRWLEKIADDLGDGLLLFMAIVCSQGWLKFVFPAISISISGGGVP